MKQKKQNRILAALLAVAMMFQMLPMMAFADDGAASSDVKIEGKEGTYTSLKEAVEKAESGDTILLGEGNYTLYGISSDGTTKDKDLTFVGLGPDKTAWNIGAKVLNSGECDTTYKDDFSLKGSKNVTFKNMTLRSGTANYLGFKHSNDTVVENCALYGRTTYWGYNSAKFIGSTFYAPNGDYAIWTYYCKEMTFENCTFNTSGKAVNVYSDFEADQRDYTINFNNCTVNSTSFNKQALNINDSNKGTHKNTININNSTVTAARDSITCSQVFGFGEKSWYNAGNTDVYLDGEQVWGNGKMLTHAYTDGEKDNAYTIDSASEWENKGDHFERKVTKTCNYCKRQFPNVTEKGYQLSYDLNGGVDAAGADYTEKIVAENKTVTLAAAPAPAQEGVYFLGWDDENGKRYDAAAPITLTANTTLTAQWGGVPPVEPAGGGSGDGGAGAVVAGALLGGAGYLLGTRLWLESTFGFVPANRIELAMALWKRADCPAPVSTELYPDIDEDDTDAQAAARWCVEQDLMKDFARTNSDGTQTVKFKPYDYVFRPQSLVKWYKLEKLLNEQQSTNA
ncbi:MAG: right-handed parallel beta-helix repeat-containing protein [Faecalibacterium sp.]|mgnify:CR=1 FL=1